ncbi:hypothetical protein GSI_03579 [Ganoderma sinense ZZ0214-1]|uniref:Uncharacterized protein n=1 Tax=Ganoderma sinense ZZ0214-1 TaxID=1077348 RepID=A0A2G8SJC9_9APHY|nr:hypothetical protein GSI_03579 [Ganoderma sinense ZZ0214-1]
MLCRAIRDLIDNTVELQYKLALARAGRVEVGQSKLCIADRLRALENLCTNGFSLPTVPFIMLPDDIDPRWPAVTDGFIPYLANNSSDLVLWRPTFPSEDAPEERRDVPAVMSHLSTPPQVPEAKMGTLAVDVAQGLLVFTRAAQPDISTPECYVYSISEGRPHSAAGPGPLRIDFEPVFVEDGFNTIEDLQIFGDVVAWSITDDTHSAVYVWNWKTSVLVWHRQSDARGSSCRVISPCHVVLVTAQAVSVYSFDSSEDAERPQEPGASLADPLCVLALPALKPAPYPPYVRTYMQFPPSAPTPAPQSNGDPGVAFGLDPALTVLTITLLLSTVDKHNLVGSDYRYAIFVPLSTLREHIDAAAHSDADTDADVGVDAGRRTVPVPWAEWGPPGTRIVRFSAISHISAMGSRCAFMRQEQGPSGELHVVLFDVRRGAGNDRDVESLFDELFDAREGLGPTLSFVEEIRTTFPVDVEYSVYGSMLSGYLLQDAVAMSSQAWGTQGGLGWQWPGFESWV